MGSDELKTANGEVVQDLQLKATDSMSYVKELPWKSIPTFKVVVPSELDAEAALRDDVISQLAYPMIIWEMRQPIKS